MLRTINNKPLISFSANTIIGGLYNYLINANPVNFQPINANFGILEPINLKDKQVRNKQYYERSMNEIANILKQINA